MFEYSDEYHWLRQSLSLKMSPLCQLMQFLFPMYYVNSDFITILNEVLRRSDDACFLTNFHPNLEVGNQVFSNLGLRGVEK
jgi:hypothetical protein